MRKNKTRQQPTSYYWDRSTARYRDVETGRFVSRSTIHNYVTQSISSATTASAVTEGGVISAGTSVYANLAAAGLVTPEQFVDLMRGEIKREYIRQYLLGAGGRDQMTQADWGRIGGMLKEQYGYLNGFADALAAGQLSEAQIAARAAMYVNSAREAFNRADWRSHLKAGYDEVRWVTNPMVENCPDCLELEALGWQRVEGDPYDGCYPGSGCTVCLCITTPEHLVLTLQGWTPLLDVQVGDLVWTHRNRWRPVTALIVKPSLEGTEEAFVRAPSGHWVGCTTDHLWFTTDGWHNIRNIDNSLMSLYHVPITHKEMEHAMPGMRNHYQKRYQERYMQIVSVGVSLRECQGLQSSRMPELCIQSQSQSTMAGTEGVYRGGYQEGGRRKTHQAKGLGRQDLASAVRWSALELVLAGGKQQEGDNLSLSVGMGYGERSNTRWLRGTSQGRGCIERRAGKPRITGERHPRQASRPIDTSGSCQEYASMDLSILRHRVQELSTREGWSTEVLLQGTCRPGTAVYDLTVEEDHSFIIEGLVSHNTNCNCELDYRKSEEEEEE